MELNRELNKKEEETCAVPGPLPQGLTLLSSPYSLQPTNFSPLNKCLALLETYPRNTSDSKERAINILSQNKVGKHKRMRKFHMARTSRGPVLKRKLKSWKLFYTVIMIWRTRTTCRQKTNKITSKEINGPEELRRVKQNKVSRQLLLASLLKMDPSGELLRS